MPSLFSAPPQWLLLRFAAAVMRCCFVLPAEVVNALISEGGLPGEVQNNDTYVPHLQAKTQTRWIDSFYKENGYIEYVAWQATLRQAPAWPWIYLVCFVCQIHTPPLPLPSNTFYDRLHRSLYHLFCIIIRSHSQPHPSSRAQPSAHPLYILAPPSAATSSAHLEPVAWLAFLAYPP